MPRKRRTARQLVSAENCAKRINYAKLKGDEGSQSSSTALKPYEASGEHRNSKANDSGNQGRRLTGALAPQSAATRRWAGVLMSTSNLDEADGAVGALGIVLETNGKSTCRIDYERFRGLFDDPMISDERKDELIELLFMIGHAVYDAGFAYEFMDQACGKVDEIQDDSAADGHDVLSSQNTTLREKFNLCAAE